MNFAPAIGLRRFAPLILAFAVAPALAQFGFRDLGIPDVLGKSSLHSISGDGQILIGEKPPAFLGETRPMFVTGYSDIHLLPLGPFGSGYAKKSSYDGSAVVGTVNMPGHEGPDFGAIWRNGHLRTLLPEPGGVRTDASAVSADGRIVVGQSDSQTHLQLQAVRWVDGQPLPLTSIFGLNHSNAEAVNADGTVIVGLGGPPVNGRAFRWTEESTEVLPALNPDQLMNSAAFDVSADGSRVVGWERHFDFLSQAVLWDNGVAIDLGFLPGGRSAQAFAISDDGSLVFGYSGTGSGNAAFVWDETNGMRKLSDILQANGVDLQGWDRLSEIRDVSADGHTILGYGYNERGFYSPFIATIPEPGTLSLAAAAFVLLGIRRGRGR